MSRTTIRWRRDGKFEAQHLDFRGLLFWKPLTGQRSTTCDSYQTDGKLTSYNNPHNGNKTFKLISWHQRNPDKIVKELKDWLIDDLCRVGGIGGYSSRYETRDLRAVPSPWLMIWFNWLNNCIVHEYKIISIHQDWIIVRIGTNLIQSIERRTCSWQVA